MNPSTKLHVLLTNDDGFEAPGIRTMRSALEARGHRVSTVAPSREQSATGTSTTTRRGIDLAQVGDRSWHLDAQPADTVLVALRHLLRNEPPDLVVCGINFGPNLGIGLHASGTIGAALFALLNGFPAIAVSAGMLFSEAAQEPRLFPSTRKVLEPAAQFTCDLVETLQQSRDGDARLLPPGVMLNVNYPPLPPEAIRGVLYPEVSDGHLIELDYRSCGETGRVLPRYRASVDPERPELEAGDVRAHLEGYITVSPLQPAWNPSPKVAGSLRRRLNGLATGD